MTASLKRFGPAAVAVAVVIGVFGLVLPKIASYRDVIDVVAELTGWEIAALALVTVWNVVTFAPPWRAAMPGIGLWHALVMTQASTAAASVFPGGEAVGLGTRVRDAAGVGVPARRDRRRCRGRDDPERADEGRASGRGGRRAARDGTAGRAPRLLTLIAVGVIGGLVGATVVALRSDASTRALGARLDSWRSGIPLLRRVPRRRSLPRAAEPLPPGDVGLLRRRWFQLVTWTLIGHLAVFVVLLVTLRAVGVTGGQVDVVEAFAAWALTRLLTAIPITPGGLGIIELGLTGALVAAGGDGERVVAAVLLYRMLTWLPPILLGVPAVLLWRRLHPLERPR